MGRILFFVFLIAAVWIAWTLKRKRNALDNEERRELKRLREKELESQGRANLPSGEPMVKCDACGVYFPKKDAVLRGERVYCSKVCRDRDNVKGQN